MAENDEIPLRSVYFYLTPECNLACRHCWIAPRFRNVSTATDYLPLPLFESVIEQAIPLGLVGIKLTGGEPLLHPEILAILEIARERDLEVSVETNGILVTPEIAGSLARCKNLSISVSLDGVDAETHEWVRGVRGSFEAACRGFRTLVEAGIRPQVIMSLFRRNADQVERLIAMAEEMGAGSVKFNIVQPSARGEQVYRDGEGLEIGEVLSIGDWVTKTLANEHGIRLFFSVPAAFKPMNTLFGEGGCGCGTCGIQTIIGVLGDGSYALCGIGETVPEMVFGHVATDRLETVWRSHPVLREIRDGLPRRLTGVCRSCVFRNHCLGNCLAQNYTQTGDLWSPFWLCSRAHEAGLFPEERLIERAD
ncbi:MAG: SynChlorMet cassette radical SAM/SPASM protein ScmF [Methanospirillum sp.]|nr:SynChlorMet cassette radical SAM/SPASM protein ScmF [Methanospirillum sp.]